MQTLFQDKDLPLATGVKAMAVLVPYPVDKAYDYIVPDDIALQVGDYVRVPLGGREVIGVVWGEAAGDVNPSKLKPVLDKFPMPSMRPVMRDFIDWVATYTMTPKGFVMKMAVSVPDGLKAPKPVKGYQFLGEASAKMSAKQQAVLSVLAGGQPLRAAEIALRAGCSSGVVKTLVKKDIVQEVDMYEAPPCKAPAPHRPGFDLSQEQAAVAAEMVAMEGFQAALLDGVTGAGKTEVYFEGVAAALKRGQQVLILLPEIALSNVFLGRFRTRFGCDPALWHSELSAGQRARTWRGVANGQTRVVVGARSALFLPYADLGMIVVDEEHDSAYKQEDSVIYHGRDMAVVRAHMGQFPIVLASATPSLETMQNVWAGKYLHLHLPDRFGGAQLPDIRLIDLREDKPERQHFIAPTLTEAVTETLARGEQALLFLNRRGYAPLTLCRGCGHRMECPRCTAWLVEHRMRGGLQCHHCGFGARVPKACPECAAEDSFAPCGPGVERIYEEAQAIFPDARILVMASDTAENQDDLRMMLEKIRDGAIDIIVGTQIIAKGHHFPNLTCVGVIDADLGLSGGELRASERVYQLLHQVAGRAGRAKKKGVVYLQSFMPEHRIMQALVDGGRDVFLEVEAAEREQARMPPFGRLAGIILSGRDEQQVVEAAKALGQIAPQGPNVQIYGPAPAPYARLRGKFRYRLLVRADKNVNIQKVVDGWVKQVKTPSTVRVVVDIDPQSFL